LIRALHPLASHPQDRRAAPDAAPPGAPRFRLRDKNARARYCGGVARPRGGRLPAVRAPRAEARTLITRIGFAVGTLVALGFPTPAVAQDAPPLQRSPLKTDSLFSILDSPTQETETLTATLSGSARLEYFARDSAIEDLRALLTGAPSTGGDDTFITADTRVRLDLAAKNIRGVAELATLPYDDGENLGLGGGLDILLKQIFADLGAGSDLTLRLGAFEYAWRIRPHGEPFLLDLGRAESFFSGPGDRDVALPAGALLKWRAGDFVEVEAFWTTAIEGGPARSDETAAGAMINFPLSERSAFLLGVLHVAGDGDPRVTTLGGGADAYFGPDREIELFGEGWLQTGSMGSGVSKRAWAAHAGARAVTGPWRAELSSAWRSGDDDPADSRDETFHSCEGLERFRIVESAEFGFDWDVNVSSIRLSLARRLGDSTEARIDAARFRLDEAAPGLDRDLGVEIDATVTHEFSRAVSLWLSGAALLGSDLLEAATPGGESDTLLVTAGLRALW
jgi:hypothetical protein